MQRAMEQIKRHEGLRLKPYRCSEGKLTIGYGHNLDDNGITEPIAKAMLIGDLMVVYDDLKNAGKYGLVESLSDARQAVILNMGLNLGVPGLLEFRRMWEALEKQDYERASTEMLASRWANQVGGRAVELSKQMESGEWQD